MAGFDDLKNRPSWLPTPKHLEQFQDSALAMSRSYIQRDYKTEAMVDMSRAMAVMKSAPQVQAENIQNAIVAHIEGLQGDLKDDEELVVYHGTGLEFIAVEQIGLPNHHVIILAGFDGQGNQASAICNVTGVHLTCKVVKVQAPQTPKRIGFIFPEKEDK